MKKTKRALSALLAAALAVSAVGTVSASAEVDVTAYPTYMDDAKSDEVQAVLENFFEKPWCNLEGDYSDYTFSKPILQYCFYDMEADPNSGKVLVGKDGTWIGTIFVNTQTNADGEYASTFFCEGADALLVDAVDSGKDFLYSMSAEYWVNGKIRQMIYVDGVTYDIDEATAIGGSPDTLTYAPYIFTEDDGVTLPTETTAVTTESSTSTLGDVNSDGAIDIADAVVLSKYVSGSVYFSDAQIAVADCNADGSIDAADAAALLQFLVHTTDGLGTTE